MSRTKQLIQAPAGHFINQICADAVNTTHKIVRLHFKFSNGSSFVVGTFPIGTSGYQICGPVMERGMQQLKIFNASDGTGNLFTTKIFGGKMDPNNPSVIDLEFSIDQYNKIKIGTPLVGSGSITNYVEGAKIGDVISGVDISYGIGESYFEIHGFKFIPDPALVYWSDWSNWSACSAEGKKTRTRTCINQLSGSLPSNQLSGSLPSDQTPERSCVGTNIETAECMNGYWSEWSPWSSCAPIGQSNVQCGGTGTMYRKRTYIPAQSGGTEAPWVYPEETKACNLAPCPVDGQFSAWSEWSVCDAKCGSAGQIKRTRTYIPAQNGGRELLGPLEEVISCAGPPCPVDGQFSAWSDWSNCITDRPCGEGYQQRTRSYVPAQFGGKDLEGTLEEKMNCMVECPEPVVDEPNQPEEPKNEVPEGQQSTIVLIIMAIILALLGIGYAIYKYRANKNISQATNTNQIIGVNSS